ncbi:MAG: S-methyl-5-thioribose-1-phosphate isomerase [Chloroflexi bacterium]|nr:S-methyl-5-thioribose-1-phosphate isomerase [Chloroflexota bacterium]
MDSVRPLEWRDGALWLLDQTLLPHEVSWVECGTAAHVADAIRTMKVRGAPAIGVAAAYGIALAAKSLSRESLDRFETAMRGEAQHMAASRPTAVNLRWGVDRMMRAIAAAGSVPEKVAVAEAEAERICREDEAANEAIGRHGAALVPEKGGVLTHCNAGALATAAYGTALGVIRAAWEQGKRPNVFHTETRPWLQGARLTAWEFAQMGIPAKVLVDSAAALLMSRGQVQFVVVGADRIAANGDTANKIGTYALALAAREHGVGFYVAAPTSTVDLSLPTGDGIPIEERAPSEVTSFAGTRTAPEGVLAWNPVFDVTPARLIAGIITEVGVLRSPYEGSLRRAVASAKVKEAV